jgi:hypothetical protein
MLEADSSLMAAGHGLELLRGREREVRGCRVGLGGGGLRVHVHPRSSSSLVAVFLVVWLDGERPDLVCRPARGHAAEES